MRESLQKLLSNTIVFEYSLPNKEKEIDRSKHTTEKDNCMKVGTTDSDVAKVIFNGIVEYSYDEWEIDLTRLDAMQRRAIKTKIRFDEAADQKTKISYGFYGEILLYLVLQHFHNLETLTARGKFCNLLERSETKGYDTYQLRYNSDEGTIELWFGEVKFYQDYKQAITKVFDSIDKALSDKYFEDNVIAIFDKTDNTHLPVKIKEIKNAWENNPDINVIQEALMRDFVLVYPIIIIFDQKKEYNQMIKEVIEYINTKAINATLTLKYKLFFMLIPVSNGKSIKEQVITWISNKEPQF